MKSCNSSSGVSLSAKLTDIPPFTTPPSVYTPTAVGWCSLLGELGWFHSLLSVMIQTLKKTFRWFDFSSWIACFKGEQQWENCCRCSVTSVITLFHRTLKKISVDHSFAPTFHAIFPKWFQLFCFLPGWCAVNIFSCLIRHFSTSLFWGTFWHVTGQNTGKIMITDGQIRGKSLFNTFLANFVFHFLSLAFRYDSNYWKQFFLYYLDCY